MYKLRITFVTADDIDNILEVGNSQGAILSKIGSRTIQQIVSPAELCRIVAGWAGTMNLGCIESLSMTHAAKQVEVVDLIAQTLRTKERKDEPIMATGQVVNVLSQA